MWRFFTRTAFRNRSKQLSGNEWRNGFHKDLHARAKMTFYVQRVFCPVAPLKKKLVHESEHGHFCHVALIRSRIFRTVAVILKQCFVSCIKAVLHLTYLAYHKASYR